LLRADLLLMENKTAAAAKEIVAADRAYGRGNEPEVMQSYSKIKSFQLKLLEDDAAGALGAVLAAVDAEKEPHFSPSRTLCRLLSAHLYLRQVLTVHYASVVCARRAHCQWDPSPPRASCIYTTTLHRIVPALCYRAQFLSDMIL